MVRQLQPDACIFSDVGPDLRWVGNESGYAAETSWATYDPVGEKGDAPAPGYVKSEQGETGQRGANKWLPAECDVSIRPGWFWHATQDQKVKSVNALLDLYYRSVGRGASFLLNVPPNWNGLVSDEDAVTLKAFAVTDAPNVQPQSRRSRQDRRFQCSRQRGSVLGIKPDVLQFPALLVHRRRLDNAFRGHRSRVGQNV